MRCLALRASETAVFDCAAVCALRSLFAQMSPREFIVGCKLCRLSAIILFSLFSTLSGISPANRSRYRPKSVHMHRQGPTTFTKFWARSAKWGRNEGSKVSPMPVFFVSNTRSLFGNFATADFRQIWTWHVNRG